MIRMLESGREDRWYRSESWMSWMARGRTWESGHTAKGVLRRPRTFNDAPSSKRPKFLSQLIFFYNSEADAEKESLFLNREMRSGYNFFSCKACSHHEPPQLHCKYGRYLVSVPKERYQNGPDRTGPNNGPVLSQNKWTGQSNGTVRALNKRNGYKRNGLPTVWPVIERLHRKETVIEWSLNGPWTVQWPLETIRLVKRTVMDRSKSTVRWMIGPVLSQNEWIGQRNRTVRALNERTGQTNGPVMAKKWKPPIVTPLLHSWKVWSKQGS